MEMLIAFVIAWVVRRAVDDKTDEFEYSNSAVRDRINAQYPNLPEGRRALKVRNAARRNTVGFGLYQLRHGWPAFRYSLIEGYREARREHKDWLGSREPSSGEKTGIRGWLQRVVNATREGWNRSKVAAVVRRVTKAAGKDRSATPPSTSANAPATDKKIAGTKDKPPRGANVTAKNAWPIPQPAPAVPITTGNEGPSMTKTGEVSGYESSKRYADAYAQSLAEAEAAREQYEASLIAGGMGKDGDVMGTLGTAGEGLSSARAGFQAHRAALDTHQQGAEYAQSKGEAAAKTEYLGAE